MSDLKFFKDLAIKKTGLPTSSEQIGSLSEEDAQPAPLGIVAGDFSGESNGIDFGIEADSHLKITAINAENPGLSEDADQGDEDGLDSEKLNFKNYPWSFETGNSKVGLAYMLSGKVGINASGEIPTNIGATISLGLQADTRLAATFIRLHDPEDKFADSVLDDLTNHFHFGFFPSAITKLKPSEEFIAAEFEAGFGTKVGVSWGQLFKADSGLLKALSPENQLLHLEAGVKAFGQVELKMRSRLQLIAWRKSANVARLEFRKARNDVAGVGAGVVATAKIGNPDDFDDAVDRILAKTLGAGTEQLGQLRKRLAEIREEIGLVSFSDADLQQIATGLIGKLGIDIPALMDAVEEGRWFENAREQLAELGALGELEEFLDTLDGIRDQISLDELTEQAQATASELLNRLQLPESDLPLLATLLDRVKPNLSELSSDLLEDLRDQLSTALDKLDLEKILSESNLAKLFAEETNSTLRELFDRFQLSRILEKLAGGADRLEQLEFALATVGDVLATLEDEDGGLADLAEALGDRFELPILQIGKKLEELAERVKKAARMEVTASATVEFTRIQTNEALFAFDLKDFQNEADTFVDMYRDLLSGRLDLAYERFDTNRSGYENVTYFDKRVDTRKQALQIGLANFLKQGSKRLRKRTRVTDIGQHFKLAFSEARKLVGQQVHRNWSASFILNAQMGSFKEKPKSSNFEFSLETGLEFEGRTKVPQTLFNLDTPLKTARKNNRAAIRFMGRVFADCRKNAYDDSDMKTLVELAFAKADTAQGSADKSPTLAMNLKMNDHALRWLWENGGPDLQANFAKSWQSSQDEGVFPKRSADSPTEDSDGALNHLLDLGKLAKGNHLPKTLGIRMREWNKLFRKAVRDPLGQDFAFKFCFIHALILTLPADLAGWNLTGSLGFLGDPDEMEDDAQTWLG